MTNPDNPSPDNTWASLPPHLGMAHRFVSGYLSGDAVSTIGVLDEIANSKGAALQVLAAVGGLASWLAGQLAEERSSSADKVLDGAALEMIDMIAARIDVDGDAPG